MVQDSDGPYEPPPAVWNLLKELSNFRVGRGIYLGNSGKSLDPARIAAWLT